MKSNMVGTFLLMFLVAHRFGCVEFWIFVLIFSTAPTCIKQQRIFEIQSFCGFLRKIWVLWKSGCIKRIFQFHSDFDPINFLPNHTYLMMGLLICSLHDTIHVSMWITRHVNYCSWILIVLGMEEIILFLFYFDLKILLFY